MAAADPVVRADLAATRFPAIGPSSHRAKGASPARRAKPPAGAVMAEGCAAG
jgi:hypothetical protein